MDFSERSGLLHSLSRPSTRKGPELVASFMPAKAQSFALPIPHLTDACSRSVGPPGQTRNVKLRVLLDYFSRLLFELPTFYAALATAARYPYPTRSRRNLYAPLLPKGYFFGHVCIIALSRYFMNPLPKLGVDIQCRHIILWRFSAANQPRCSILL